MKYIINLFVIFLSASSIVQADSVEEQSAQIEALYITQVVSNLANENEMMKSIKGLCKARYGENSVTSECFLVHMKALSELNFVAKNNVFVNNGVLTLNGTIISSCKKYYAMGDLQMMMECVRVGGRALPKAGMLIPKRSIAP